MTPVSFNQRVTSDADVVPMRPPALDMATDLTRRAAHGINAIRCFEGRHEAPQHLTKMTAAIGAAVTFASCRSQRLDGYSILGR